MVNNIFNNERPDKQLFPLNGDSSVGTVQNTPVKKKTKNLTNWPNRDIKWNEYTIFRNLLQDVPNAYNSNVTEPLEKPFPLKENGQWGGQIPFPVEEDGNDDDYNFVM